VVIGAAVLPLCHVAAPPGLSAQHDSVLTLQAAVQLALASHPMVASARAARSEAGSRVGEALAARWPQLSTQGALTRHQLPMIVAPLHGFDPAAPPTFDRTLVQGTGQVSYLLFDGGARGARLTGLRAEERAADAGLSAAIMRLTADVTRAYLAVLSASERREAQRQGLAALESERNRAALALEVGRAAQVDVLRVEAALAQADADDVVTTVELDVAVRALARALGLEPERTAPAVLREVRLRDTAFADDRDSLARRAAMASPDLEAARRRLEAAEQGRRAARAAWFPRLELGGGYLGFGSGAGDFTTEWQGALRLSYPLFQGGARRSAVAAAGARAQAAAEQHRLALMDLEAAVDRTLAAVREARARVRAMTRAVLHLTEVVRIEQLALEAGAGTQADFLRAEADLRRSRAGLIDARHGEILARVELLRLTGELALEPLAALVESAP
jgi:outer membrane protein TolC